MWPVSRGLHPRIVEIMQDAEARNDKRLKAGIKSLPSCARPGRARAPVPTRPELGDAGKSKTWQGWDARLELLPKKFEKDITAERGHGGNFKIGCSKDICNCPNETPLLPHAGALKFSH